MFRFGCNSRVGVNHACQTDGGIDLEFIDLTGCFGVFLLVVFPFGIYKLMEMAGSCFDFMEGEVD